MGDHIVRVIAAQLQLGRKDWNPPQGPIICCSFHHHGSLGPNCPRGLSFNELLPDALRMGISKVRFFGIHQVVYGLCEELLFKQYLLPAQPGRQAPKDKGGEGM